MARFFVERALWCWSGQSGTQNRSHRGLIALLIGNFVLIGAFGVPAHRAYGHAPLRSSDTSGECSQPAGGVGDCDRFGAGLVSFPTVDVRAEVAENAVDHARGLGGHAPLGTTDGMIFVFQTPGSHAFWMKGMTFNLDILWIDGAADSLKVVHLASDVPAFPTDTPDGRLPIYSPSRPARYVLEVNAGFADDHGITIGTPVTFIRDLESQP